MDRYICHRESTEQFHSDGSSLGMSGESAIYYATALGRGRCYRQGYPIPHDKGLKLFSYKSLKRAQELCDHTNEIHNDSFKPLLISI